MSHPKRNQTRKLGWTSLAAALLLAASPGWAEHAYDDYAEYSEDTSYSYPRVIEGSATVLAAGGERESVEANQPILVGDRLWVPHGTRLEIVLADRSLLRIEGESEIDFDRIAYSADADDRTTVLRLREAELQMVVPEDVLGETLPQIETQAGTVFLHRAGVFRVRAGHDFTELVVREGLAELVTEHGSVLIHPGEAGIAEDGYRPRLDVRTAGRRDSLERWGDYLTAEAEGGYVPYVDRSLRYAAAPLAHHGAWIEVGSRWGWRPRVELSWRPYYRGYWRHTPIGLTWVSYDPWGYVTHHYGSWDLVPGYGWVWYPGRAYAPARVHWYWGPSYVGWCPSGYYDNYYRSRHRGYGLSVGLYGWAGGSWSHFSFWTFTASDRFGARHGYGYRGRGHRYDYDRFHHRGADLARRGDRLERGILAAHSRALAAEHRPAKDVYRSLEAKLSELRRHREIPDATDFVARKPLRADLAEVVLAKPGSKPALPVLEKPVRLAKPNVGDRPVLKPATKPGVVPSKPALADPGRAEVLRGRVEAERSKPTLTRPGTPGREIEKPGRVESSKPILRSAPRGREIEKPGRVESSKPVLRSAPREERKPVRIEPRPGSAPTLAKPGPPEREIEKPGRVERSRRALEPAPRTKPSTRSIERRPMTRSKPSVDRRPVTRSKPSVDRRPVTRSTPSVDRRPVTRSTPSIDRRPVTRSAPRVERSVPSRRPVSKPSVSPSRRAPSKPSVSPSRRAPSRSSVAPSRRAPSKPSVAPSRRAPSKPSVSSRAPAPRPTLSKPSRGRTVSKPSGAQNRSKAAEPRGKARRKKD